MLGSILGAVGSIFGASKAAKAQKQANRITQKNNEAQLAFAREQLKNSVRYRVNDAKAAGIHPLAALGANVGTVTPSLASPMAATAMGDGIAAGASQLGNAVDKYFAQDMQNLQTELLKAQIDQVKSVTSMNVARSRSIINSQRTQAINPGQPLLTKTKPSSTGIVIDGQLMPNAGNSDAEEVEAKYGDIIQNLYGTYNLGADLWKGYKDGPGKRAAQQMRKDRKENPRKYNWKEEY